MRQLQMAFSAQKEGKKKVIKRTQSVHHPHRSTMADKQHYSVGSRPDDYSVPDTDYPSFSDDLKGWYNVGSIMDRAQMSPRYDSRRSFFWEVLRIIEGSLSVIRAQVPRLAQIGDVSRARHLVPHPSYLAPHNLTLHQTPPLTPSPSSSPSSPLPRPLLSTTQRTNPLFTPRSDLQT